MKFLPTPFLLLISLFFTILNPVQGQEIDLEWKPRQDLNISLPSSVKIYEANGFLPDSSRIRAHYAKIDLTDENLKLRAIGSNSIRQTTEEAYHLNNAILAINGGYFSNNASVSLLVSDGKVISPGPVGEGIKGAFGMENETPVITWSNAKTPTSDILKYEKPNSSSNGSFWNVDQAVGGGPVLLKNGKINVTSQEEGFGGSHLQRHPRTAIGYSDKDHLIMMVVDGRQKSSSGVTLPELAQLMKDVGATEAVNLDGGGSSAMIAANEVVNIPVDITGGDRNSLRNNASALILSQVQEVQDNEVFIFDTADKIYSEEGLWRESNERNFYANTPSRIASSAYSYNKAFYRFDSLPRKEYQLAAWWTVDPEKNAEEVTFIIHHGQETDRVKVDQSDLSTSGKWNVLGNYVLGPGDSVEIIGTGNTGNMVTDALRLVSTTNSPEVPVRGDLRIAVLSDLNSGLGATDYEWQVDSIISRIPRIWKPDLVLIAGDMVAGMGVSDSLQLQKMWEGFDKAIAEPLQEAGIPFAFTLGNHDGSRSYPVERRVAIKYWQNPENDPGLTFIDKRHFPNYYSFRQGDIFFVSWDASSPDITKENLAWLEEQFNKPQAQNAAYRILLGHMPLYSVAQERDSKGNVLENPEQLQNLLEKYNVHTYISGHQHAYYPGKHGDLQLLHSGAAGSGPRSWLSQEMEPVNTMTILDVFPQEDTIAYTTYKIKEKLAENMEILKEESLPSAIFGVNGYVLRRDIPIAEVAKGEFSSFNSPEESTETGKGSIIAEFDGNDILFSGHYFSLKGKLEQPDPIAVFKGRNTEKGELLTVLEVKQRNKNLGTFSGEVKANRELRELLSIGALYAVIKTDEGTLRTQLYPEKNEGPPSPRIISHNGRNVYAVRDEKAFFEIDWNTAADDNGDFVSFIYQLSSDRHFNNIILQENTGRSSSFAMTEAKWYELLKNSGVGEAETFYHRVIATDGKNITYSPTEPLKLMKSNEPLYDLVEVPAPNYKFKGTVKNASGGGYGAVWDDSGKLWLANYSGKLLVKEKDGSEAAFSPVTEVEINGRKIDLGPITGIGKDPDGNILLGNNRKLIKIDSETGRGIALWEVPDGERAITSPRVNSKGEIYAMSLFAEDPDYILKQSTKDPTTFELLRTIELKDRILSRTFDMSADGLTLYFPNPGSAEIQKYTSTDGINYIKSEDITSISSGSSAIKVLEDNQLFAAVRASGISPSTIHFRDEVKKEMWTLELPEVNGAEPRGIGVSPDKKTLIFAAWDKGGGFYKYELEE